MGANDGNVISESCPFFQSDEEDAMSKSQDSILSAMKPRKTGLDALGFKHVAAERNVAPTTGSTVNHDEIKKNAASIATGAVRDISLRPIPQRNTILGANRMSEWGTPAMKASVSAQSEHDAPKSKKLQLKNIINDHKLSLEELANKFSTKINLKTPSDSFGLTKETYLLKLDEHGANIVRKKIKIPWYLKLLECVTNLFNLLLIFAGIVFFIFYFVNPMDNFHDSYIGGTMIAIAFINSSIEFYEIQKISGLLESFTDMVKSELSVIRAGKLESRPPGDLVPGDIMKLCSGVKIPADAVLFHASNLRVDMSSLTGESMSVDKKPLENGAKDTIEAHESSNMVFSSNIVVSGEGYAIVTGTGKNTLMSQINLVASSEKRKRSPLSVEIRTFCRRISVIAVIISAIFFFVALVRGRNFNYAVTFAIGILLAWIPQGLPLTVTMLLALAGRRMLQKNVVVKDLHGIETLGAITLLASDKTGTLTKNEMEVTELWVNKESFVTKATPGQKVLKLDFAGVAQLLHIGATCSRARLETVTTDSGVTEKKASGSPTEAALLQFASSKLKNIDQLNDLFPKVFEVPFSSDNKYHLTIHRKGHSQGGLTLHIKGAPEVIWETCSTILVNGKSEPITEADKAKFEAANRNMCEKGHRVIAFAMLQLRGDKFPDNYRFSFDKKNYPLRDLTFVGLTGLTDPPKPGVDEAIVKIRTAGIKVMVITGDQGLTAMSVARNVNILTNEQLIRVSNPSNLPVSRPIQSKNPTSIVVLGSVLTHLTDEDWLNILLHDEIIFARTMAIQKLEIVARAQSLGHIVAVTGDGFNDSPALKKADIGIAMNVSGSDISKDSAGIILLDDNFASTADGIYEGRLIFINLKKAIQYILTHLVAQALPYILFVIVPIPLAITSTQILVIDLGFELILTLSFGWEPAEDPDMIMKMEPRKHITNDIAIKNFERNRQLEQLKLTSSHMSLHKSNADLNDSVYLLHNDEEYLDDSNQAATATATQSRRLKGRMRTYFGELKQFLSDRQYWKSFFYSMKDIVHATDEKLVDSRVLMWSYVEGGGIECFGALFTFFAVLWIEFGISPTVARQGQIRGGMYWKPHSPDLIREDGSRVSGDVQYEALMQAQSGFYLSVLVIQLFNLLACKARDRLPFGKFMFRNEKTWIAMFGGTALALLVVYTPVSNAIFHTSMALNPVYVLMPIVFGLLLFIVSCIKTFLNIRRKSRNKLMNPFSEHIKNSIIVVTE